MAKHSSERGRKLSWSKTLDNSVDITQIKIEEPDVQQGQLAIADTLCEDVMMHDDNVNPADINVEPTRDIMGKMPRTACKLQNEVVGNSPESMQTLVEPRFNFCLRFLS